MRGRPKLFVKHTIPHCVVQVVRAHCADYQRKENALKDSNLSPEIRRNYETVNASILESLEEIEEMCRSDFLADIADNRGYEKSRINWLFSKTAYYNRKDKAIYDIAKKLNLV